jgi:hypothetical protein
VGLQPAATAHGLEAPNYFKTIAHPEYSISKKKSFEQQYLLLEAHSSKLEAIY